MPITHAAEPKLSGKTAIIVGASAGMGLASARLFAEHGANVIMVGRNQQRLQEAAELIGEQAVPAVADVRDESQLKDAFDIADERWGELHVVFNNAGPGDGGSHNIADMTADIFDDFIAVNLRAAFLGMKYAIPLMERAGGGSIISTSSIGGISGVPGAAGYCAAKAGCHALSRSLAAEYSDKHIRANVIVPGQVTTRFGLPSDAPQSEADLEVIRARGRRLSPMERAGEAEDVANLALFLASDDSSYITGQEFVIDGGMTAVNHWIRAIREG
ncbi:MAG: SDR family NAD(P)-dependent oxidoreductase [Chloroflexi bacterium]|nr:SDR family NAD(P)-dependent oxidoreductase [Chloroflexota bacterium]MCY3686650.1 SDR family NAD(P)-dependent oxidoreductase [Chloroflexota bacterium]MCY3697467.1 SDR family NAD(P)-dependent oxidoreductase [Chloroflexota bacterium]